MDNLNKVISFVLGLVVVVVFAALLAGRIGPFKGLSLFSKNTPTPTVTPTPKLGTKVVVNTNRDENTNTASNNPKYRSYSQNTGTKGGSATSIPSTGSETLLLPLLGFAGAFGAYLKKYGRKTS